LSGGALLKDGNTNGGEAELRKKFTFPSGKLGNELFLKK
jgi:hypothetical protein